MVDVLRDPVGRACSSHRERTFIWGYGHIVIFGALAAIGAGLHVAAYYLEHKTAIGPTGTVLSTAIPFSVYILALYGIYAAFTRHADPFHLSLLAGTGAVVVLSVVLAASESGSRSAWWF